MRQRRVAAEQPKAVQTFSVGHAVAFGNIAMFPPLSEQWAWI